MPAPHRGPLQDQVDEGGAAHAGEALSRAHLALTSHAHLVRNNHASLDLREGAGAHSTRMADLKHTSQVILE